jgi:hypothetical protein
MIVEHALAYLFDYLCDAYEKSLQKPLRKVVPELARLYADPAGVLNHGPIVIGPANRRRTSIFTSLVVLFCTWGLAGLVVYDGGEYPLFILIALSLVVVLIGTFLSIFLLVRKLDCGEMVLHGNGVEMRHYRTIIFCPWALFNVKGQPRLDKASEVTLPVSRWMIPFVKHQTIDKGGEVRDVPITSKTRPLVFLEGGVVRLRALYEANLQELGDLLLFLGRTRGIVPPDEPMSELDHATMSKVVLVEPTTRTASGWITTNVAYLVRPAICCRCCQSVPCDNRDERYFPIFSPGLFAVPGLELPHYFPICKACRASVSKEIRVFVMRCAVFGFVVGIILSIVFFYLNPMGRDFILSDAVPLEILTTGSGFLLGLLLGTARTAPIQYKRPNHEKGRLTIRFRNTDYEKLILDRIRSLEEIETGEG